MIDLTVTGAHASIDAANHVILRFGVFLPGIRSADSYSVLVRLIHEQDQFTPGIKPRDYSLAWQAPLSGANPSAYDLWTNDVDLTADADPANRFGQPGAYVYRYQLLYGGQVVCTWFTDPFARATGIGELASVTAPDPAAPAQPFVWGDTPFRTPDLDDLVVYELQVAEFNQTFDGVAERLDYLRGLGVNAVELMPVTSIKQEFDWGYGPLHFFAPEERFGGPAGMKRLVDACHHNDVAVILDSVYEHVDEDFPYRRVYVDAGLPSPFVGRFAEDLGFGPEADFAKVFTRDFFDAVNRYWLEEYHVDGFRYDYVPGYYDGPLGVGYADLVYRTYQQSLPLARFGAAAGAGSYSRIIQTAENLDHPREILRDTYTDATWQDGLLNAARQLANNPSGNAADAFVHLLDPTYSGYRDTKDMNGISVPVAPFQYIESHDHSYLLEAFGIVNGIGGKNDTTFGDRGQFFKLQPYVIALYTCQGVPMLWQGQEFGQNDILASGGNARISIRREMRWEYFYDAPGQALIRLYRILGHLRRTCRALRSRESFYYFQQSRPADGVVAYHRIAPSAGTEPEQVAVVFLNFSDHAQELSVPFPRAGTYRERLDDPLPSGSHQDITAHADGEWKTISVPSNYGAVYVSPA